MTTFKKANNLSIEERLERFNQLNERAERMRKVNSLKKELSSTDYKIIKCYEYSLIGMELPYDVKNLHFERESIREQIRELEEE
jgi:hypothetical protein